MVDAGYDPRSAEDAAGIQARRLQEERLDSILGKRRGAGQMRINGEKLALLIPRLASEFDGEVVATVRAIRRLLEASGHDLHDLARIVAGGKIGHMANKAQNLRPEYQRTDAAGIIVVAEHLLATFTRLSAWEREFVESILDQARARYGFKMSDKQNAKWEIILLRASHYERGHHG